MKLTFGIPGNFDVFRGRFIGFIIFYYTNNLMRNDADNRLYRNGNNGDNDHRSKRSSHVMSWILVFTMANGTVYVIWHPKQLKYNDFTLASLEVKYG